MFGVTLDGPSDVMCDNQGVVNNMRLPQYNLGKKNNAVNYHIVHEAAATGILQVGKEDMETNLNDIPTKISVWKRHHKLSHLFHIQAKFENGIYKSLGLWAFNTTVSLGV